MATVVQEITVFQWTVAAISFKLPCRIVIFNIFLMTAAVTLLNEYWRLSCRTSLGADCTLTEKNLPKLRVNFVNWQVSRCRIPLVNLSPNSESKEETCMSGQGFNINSTQLFLI